MDISEKQAFAVIARTEFGEPLDKNGFVKPFTQGDLWPYIIKESEETEELFTRSVYKERREKLKTPITAMSNFARRLWLGTAINFSELYLGYGASAVRREQQLAENERFTREVASSHHEAPDVKTAEMPHRNIVLCIGLVAMSLVGAAYAAKHFQQLDIGASLVQLGGQ